MNINPLNSEPALTSKLKAEQTQKQIESNLLQNLGEDSRKHIQDILSLYNPKNQVLNPNELVQTSLFEAGLGSGTEVLKMIRSEISRRADEAMQPKPKEKIAEKMPEDILNSPKKTQSQVDENIVKEKKYLEQIDEDTKNKPEILTETANNKNESRPTPKTIAQITNPESSSAFSILV